MINKSESNSKANKNNNNLSQKWNKKKCRKQIQVQ